MSYRFLIYSKICKILFSREYFNPLSIVYILFRSPHLPSYLTHSITLNPSHELSWNSAWIIYHPMSSLSFVTFRLTSRKIVEQRKDYSGTCLPASVFLFYSHFLPVNHLIHSDQIVMHRRAFTENIFITVPSTMPSRPVGAENSKEQSGCAVYDCYRNATGYLNTI